MIGRSLISFLVPFVIGLSLVYRCARAGGKSAFLMTACLATGLGLALSSLCFFTWLVLFPGNASFAAFAAFEAITALAVAIPAVLLIKPVQWSEAMDDERPPALVSLGIYGILFFMFIINAAAFIALSRQAPHGGWDAWAIWNMRARFLFGGGQWWAGSFSKVIGWAHPDYPVLLPGIIARAWRYLGEDARAVPAIVACAYTFLTVGLLVSSLSLLRNPRIGALAGIVLLSAPLYLTCGASQYADVPLSFYYLATCVFFFLRQRCDEAAGRSLMCMAGLAAGCAAWLKNEGQLFIVLFVCARFLAAIPSRGFSKFFREMAFFAAGAFLPCLAVLYTKIRFALPAVDYAAQVTVKNMFDPGRWFGVAVEFVKRITLFGGNSVPLVPLLAAYVWIVGLRPGQRGRPEVLTACFLFCLMAIDYFSIYLFTPHDYTWMFAVNFDRLLLHLWPSAVFVLFFITLDPLTNEKKSI